MMEARVISINPGEKTLGELNNPTFGRVESMSYTALRSRSHTREGMKLFGPRDSRRPPLLLLVIRILLTAASLWCASLVPHSALALAMCVFSLLSLLGLTSRIAAAAEVGMASVALLHLVGTSMLPEMLTGAAVVTLLGLFIAFCGPGRYSLDYRLFK